MSIRPNFSGATLSALGILFALIALAGPTLFNIHPHPGAIVSASHSYPSVSLEIDPKVVNQMLSGCNATSKGQAKALLDTQMKFCAATVQQVEQRAKSADAQASAWERQVAVLNAEKEAERQQKRTSTIVMIVLTGLTVVLFIVAYRSANVPEWAKDVIKIAAGAVFAGWFKG